MDRWIEENVTQAIARLIYELRTRSDWQRAHVDPATDPFYLHLARERVERNPPPQPPATTAREALSRALACPEFRPDHNGECLNCDEPADAHHAETP